MQQSRRESDGFEEFYERNFAFVYRLCYTYMRSKADAEDCAEDVFVKTLTGRYVFKDFEHERKWLAVTSINLCKDKLKHWWRKKVEPIVEDVFVDEKVPSPDTALDAVMKLPTKYKDVIYLYYYMDMKTDEIAASLKKPPSTIRNNLKEARELLKKQLGEF